MEWKDLWKAHQQLTAYIILNRYHGMLEDTGRVWKSLFVRVVKHLPRCHNMQICQAAATSAHWSLVSCKELSWLLRHEVIISFYRRVQRLISTYWSLLLLAMSFCTTPESTTTLPTSQQVQLLPRGCSSKTFSAYVFPTSNQFSLYAIESFESTWKLCGVNPCCCAQNFKPLPLKVSHIKRFITRQQQPFH